MILSPLTTTTASRTRDGPAIVIIRAARITVVCAAGVCAEAPAAMKTDNAAMVLLKILIM
jgi:hypothetical protein